MSKPNVLLIGAGKMGSFHARVIAESEKAKLFGIVDPDSVNGPILANKYGTTWYPELPNVTGVDASVVATPTEYHFEIAKTLLSERIPLLLEKPITSDLNSSRQLIELATSSSTPLMCGFLERFNPAVMTAMNLIEEPMHVTTTRHSPYAPRIQTGVSWDLLIHDVDLVSRVFKGAVPTKITSSLGFFHPESINTAEDVVESIIQFDNGGVAQSSASRIGQRKVRSMVVNELDKLIEIDLLRRDVTIYRNVSSQMVDSANRGYRQQAVIEIPEIITSQEPLAAQFNHFLSILSNESDWRTEINSLLPAHLIIDSVISNSLNSPIG